jgi:hypothetical protein
MSAIGTPQHDIQHRTTKCDVVTLFWDTLYFFLNLFLVFDVLCFLSLFVLSRDVTFACFYNNTDMFSVLLCLISVLRCITCSKSSGLKTVLLKSLDLYHVLIMKFHVVRH